MALEDGVIVVHDFYIGGCEDGWTAMVTQLVNRQEGLIGHVRE